jgi:type VI secretion system secreted protein VgrG
MMADLQSGRQIEVRGPLGPNDLLFRRMTATEAISQLFTFDVELYSDDIGITIDDVLGKPMTIALDLPGGGQRFFNGYVAEFACEGISGRHVVYRAKLRPWLWLLTRTSDCRIFQHRTVPDIIKQIFREYGFPDFKDDLSESYSEWVYCVQYRETDFNFVSRLMEHEGINYFFSHDDGKHVLNLVDAPMAHQAIPDYESLPYLPPSAHQQVTHEHVFEIAVGQEVRAGAHTLTDYDFELPRSDLQVKLNQPLGHDHGEYEVYSYPGAYLKTGDGEQYNRVRLEQLQTPCEIMRGAAIARGLSAGSVFDLTDCAREDLNRGYLLLEVQHTVVSDEYESGGSEAEEVHTCQFTAMDQTRPFRAPQVTPKPLIRGPQTALVVGKQGEEIWTDKHGRIKVQFHWDREGGKDENSSCWIRVAHMWAGKGWGHVSLPRIGQEVVVEFLEGDPDRPLITGRVYNGDNMPPYELPANKTQSGVKSRSSKGGGGGNFNEIRFEDKKGSEEVYRHAEKDENIVVENDKTEDVGHDETLTVHNNRTRKVDVDEQVTIGNNQTVTVMANRTDTVQMNENRTVILNQQQTVGVARNVTVGASQSHEVGVNDATIIGVDQQLDVGGSRTHTVSDDEAITIGKTLSIDVGDQITLKTGKAMIVMKKDGTINISGKDITVEGSSQITIKASKNVVIKGDKVLTN